MEAARTSETSVENYFTWQYIPEDNSEQHGTVFVSRNDLVGSRTPNLDWHIAGNNSSAFDQPRVSALLF
jgi:hypothetical protein